MSQIPDSNSINLRNKFIRTPLSVGVTLILAALGFYLLITHTGHVLVALPYLFLMACPLMHIFMHRGHQHGERH